MTKNNTPTGTDQIHLEDDFDVPIDLKGHLQDILRNAPADFTTNIHGRFSQADMEQIQNRAQELLKTEVRRAQPQTHDDLAGIWNKVVSDFHENEGWGFHKHPPSARLPEDERAKVVTLGSYLRAFIVPTFVLKSVLFYFGVQYSYYPDRGYGYGLAITIALSLINFSWFIWVHRHDS